MSKSYVIQWKSTVNGRTGKGTNRFELEQAESLAEELNREYPQIHHEVVPANQPTEALGARGQPGELTEAAGESPQVIHNPEYELSVH